MEDRAEQALIAGAKAGDQLAYERLLEPTIRSATRLAFAMLHDRSEAEDAFQESALRAWRRLQIFIVNVDGRSLRQLTLWSELAGDPDWSPDGSRIVHATHPLRVDWGENVESELITILPDGTGRTVLTKFGLGGPRGTQPRWTPDGKAIVYTKQSNGPVFTRHIWAIAADGSSDIPILTARLICTNPVMQP